MTELLAVTAPKIFDSEVWLENAALLVQGGRVLATVPVNAIPGAARRIDFSEDLVPGFVDLQVNGGGGILFNNQPDLDAIRCICMAHAQFGTTALLPTLITDTVAVTEAAMAAGIEAATREIPGFLGLHLEGPHLAVARKGTHDPALIRPMTSTDLDRLIVAREHLPVLLVTVAPESVTTDQVEKLVDAGIIVSVGHSDADLARTERVFAAGARQATHLFNAMSQLQSREPGVVGAALAAPHVFAGLIADGIHVHPTAIRLALAAKQGPGRIFLVTDAMSQTGTDITSFSLNGRTIHRANGALRLENGTLAGADLDMIDAVRFMHEQVGLPWTECLRMASLYPSRAAGIQRDHGHLKKGAMANFIQMSEDKRVVSTWIKGREVYGGAAAGLETQVV
ncbi:N-acetylglucosamine-6-phosphate deacetylase [Devosia sp. RR2S18]|uniref:N-acetylglucosamine-6-phosphate deacetylase n=1 Tax=Devosia rhizosphaerae TaxID=3049774 RepID=UPI00253FF3FA|nr:N-acetylglucosamine-6-phosphate deacetylase [Devosia sp. RR2S18]WIJ27010.1 N-acetylglucosamine-6-phosphate deacetylase [Devosia sp. RR2S18]